MTGAPSAAFLPARSAPTGVRFGQIRRPGLSGGGAHGSDKPPARPFDAARWSVDPLRGRAWLVAPRCGLQAVPDAENARSGASSGSWSPFRPSIFRPGSDA